MNKIKFELSLEETNLILESLGYMPYSRVQNLIPFIANTAKEQLPKEEAKVVEEIK